jgi:cytochrome c-type biogenesis protein CcmH/NrfG
MADRPDEADAARRRAEEEREFLLRSLDDLDAERADGNIDEGTFERLHGDYTARAAAVLHRLDGDDLDGLDGEGADAGTPGASAPGGRPWLVAGGIAVFAVIVGLVLAWGLGARLPGGTVTGDQGQTAPARQAALIADLRTDVRRSPEDPQARLALARSLMGAQRGADALEQFRQAARLDPTDPEPFAYSGWLIRLQGFPDQALVLIDKAIEVDPEYPDARFFRGIILLRERDDPEAAITEFRRYLVLAPDSPLAPQVRTLLAEAVEAGSGSAPEASSTTTSTP